jgi:predicted MFS family arabinose efflux permease
VFLTGLRWLPVGFLAPVVVLLASSRGLSATDIGLVFTMQGGLVVALELPTGGLADNLGRRPVLLVSGLLNVAALLALVAAQELSGFLVAAALLGVARALDSGPLEAWFVDAVQRADPAAGTTAGFAQAGVATGVALTVGAATGGLLPRLFDSQLTAPVLTAAAFTAVQTLLVLLLVVPTGSSGRLGILAETLRTGLVAIPATVRAASTLAREDPVLRVLVLMSFGVGAVLNTVELLAPLRFADLLGGQTQASGVYGAVVALGFAGGAAGSALTQRARRLARGSTPLTMAGAHLLGAVAFAVFAAGSTSVVLAVAYAISYVANALAWPLRQQLLHSRVGAAQRATMVSVASLALQAGGLVSNLVAPRIYGAFGATAAFAGATAALLGLAAATLLLPRDPKTAENRV